MTFEDFATTLQKFGTIVVNDEDTEKPQIVHLPSVSFYGCSFNFADEGRAESRYYGEDDVYNPRKEV